MIYVIGDVHWKHKEPYRTQLIKLFDELFKDVDKKDTILIFTGDFLDSSSPHAEYVLDIAISKLLEFKEVHIISGNHELNKGRGNILKVLNNFSNIHTYLEKQEVEIEGLKFLMLPYLSSVYRMKEEYENFEWAGDYCVTHTAPLGSNWGNIDEIDLSKIKAIKFYGHIHDPKDIDNHNIQVGVPMMTRKGEESWKNRIIKVNNKDNWESILCPKLLDIEVVKYGEMPEISTNLTIVIDAPSVRAIREKYSNYYILESHCEILRTENELDINEQKEILNTNLLDNFNIFSREKEYPKEIHDCCIQFLNTIEN